MFRKLTETRKRENYYLALVNENCKRDLFSRGSFVQSSYYLVLLVLVNENSGILYTHKKYLVLLVLVNENSSILYTHKKLPRTPRTRKREFE